VGATEPTATRSELASKHAVDSAKVTDDSGPDLATDRRL
jgi:hypothetical protein